MHASARGIRENEIRGEKSSVAAVATIERGGDGSIRCSQTENNSGQSDDQRGRREVQLEETVLPTENASDISLLSLAVSDPDGEVVTKWAFSKDGHTSEQQQQQQQHKWWFREWGQKRESCCCCCGCSQFFHLFFPTAASFISCC